MKDMQVVLRHGFSTNVAKMENTTKLSFNGYVLSSQDKILHPTRIHLNAGNDINDIKCYQFDNVPVFVLKGYSYKHKRQKLANCNI